MTSPTPGFLQRRSVKIIALGLAALGIAFAVYRYFHQPPRYKGVARLQVDLRRPEFLVASQNLARLPKDVAAAPALAGLVDEALVFHYEEDEARLSVEGALRRLAWEHDLSLEDRFLATLLAAPAEIAFWRAGKGRPEHFVAALERGALGKLAEALAKVSLDDRQLKQAGTFNLGGDPVTLYTLDYGGGRSLAFAGRKDRWVFLSDPRLALDAEGKPSADAAAILGDLLHGRHPWQDRLPAAAGAQHSLVVGPAALSLDYAHFLPALAGLRLDHDGKAWKAALRIDPKALPAAAEPAAIWRSVPLGSALCAALPVNWPAAAGPIATLIGDDPALAPTLAALDPVAAVCWSADARLAAPLFVARAAQPLPPQGAGLLAKLAGKAWDGAADAPAGSTAVHSATVPSRHGLRPAGGGDRAFRPALALQDGVLAFSPDRRQVEAAVAVAAKRAPALGDEPGLKGAAWLVADPARLAALTKSEIQEVLPPDEESFFREVARSQLWPRLEAWGKSQKAMAAVPGASGSDGFIPLEFKPLRGDVR